jgi:ABC-type multidrug transport system fused ATPase/permease subunit
MGAMKNIIRAPLLKHTDTSASILLNRSGKDQESVDNGLIVSAAAFAVMMGVLFFTSVTILFKNWPYTSLPLTLTLGLYTLLSVWYRRAMREAKRQESTARTPICSRASELSTGLAIIKGLHMESKCAYQLADLIDQNASFRFLLSTCQVWFTLRIELIGALLTFFVGLGAAVSGMQPALAGLLLSYCGSLSGLTMWTIRQLAHTETNLIAWRRLMALQENFEPETSDGTMLEPLNGPVSIELCDLHASIGNAPILRGINITFSAGSKTCIIGRTGSGKSSLLLMLLRVLPIQDGTILINGRDIRNLSLESLRLMVDYVPQEALLFEGETLRFNLDPNGTKSDAEIWSVLQCLHVDGYTLDAILSSICPMYIKELIVLGRALVQGNSVLLMDEPLASLPSSHLRTILADPHFLCLLQAKTVVIVTHRPQLIDFCGRVLRLVDGQLLS